MYKRLLIIFIILGTSVLTFGQVSDCKYCLEIKEADEGWSSLKLPKEQFKHFNRNFSDIRIISVAGDNDTLENPYYVEDVKLNTEEKFYDLPLVNASTNQGESFLTILNESNQLINKLEIETPSKNYDINIKVEGSQNNSKWFEIENNKRIVNINDDLMSYNYNTMIIKDVNFKYFRLRYKSNKDFKIDGVKSSKTIENANSETQIPIKSYNIVNKDNLTEISVDLNSEYPISKFKCTFNEDEFHRPFSLHFISDSIQTKDSIKPVYNEFYTGMFTSYSDEAFPFKWRTLDHFKIVIKNYNNQPLNLSSIKLFHTDRFATTRLNKGDRYFFCFGNKKAMKPIYDIVMFKDKIPKDKKRLDFDNGFIINKEEVENQPFTLSYVWLYIVFLLIVILLGYATLKMMKNKDS